MFVARSNHRYIWKILAMCIKPQKTLESKKAQKIGRYALLQLP